MNNKQERNVFCYNFDDRKSKLKKIVGMIGSICIKKI